jgi:molybdopterin/thiamine biosynthesis adenylyltransferase
VAIMDSTVVKEEDLGGQFFLCEDDVGKRTRAEASVDGLQVSVLRRCFIAHASVLSCLFLALTLGKL